MSEASPAEVAWAEVREMERAVGRVFDRLVAGEITEDRASEALLALMRRASPEAKAMGNRYLKLRRAAMGDTGGTHG